MSKDEQIECLLRTKQWEDLTTEERQLVLSELKSEEHYRAMQRLDVMLDQSRSVIDPAPETLSRLVAEIRHNKKSERPVFQKIFFYQVPAWSVAMIVLLFGFLFWLSVATGTRVTQPQNVYITRTDTLFIQSPADTVVVDRVVYRNVYRTPPAMSVVGQRDEVQSPTPVAIGVSMKEKAELDNLLVSGSEK